MWPEPRPADAHDARLLAQFVQQVSGFRGGCGQNHAQLMVMMQFVLQASGASGTVWPEPHPADAHDAPKHMGQFVLQASGA